MAFKVQKVTRVKRLVTVNVPIDGEQFRQEKITVGYNIFTNSEIDAIRKKLIDEKSTDINGDFLRNHAIASIEGVEDETGTALSTAEALDVQFIAYAIDQDYSLTSSGVKRKN